MEEKNINDKDFTNKDFSHGNRADSGNTNASEIQDSQMNTDVPDYGRGQNNNNNANRDFQRNNQEETSAELTPGTRSISKDESRNNQLTGMAAGKGMGYAALIVSILSLFAAPILFGIVGIVLGFMARRNKESRALGSWAIGIGAFSLIIGTLILPFF
ncbi:lipopolysaccharide export LptBFGC system permease protein LptF [Peribacillus deserti]|uniref:Lipopolysaccharide export LptBFGC system permease protein LptF n=1 Tax=Peribacillus deserti TaxID=673318 RepID=A0ABS2QJG9_9BACI|nr:DUF4190 domain-containing protein [Peribacillus deserti]MBM7693317.1 lipopolysaccharide export LptBFGC system permease protein LptF [Peribacillus deserti]